MSEIRKGVHEFDGSQKIDTWVDLIEKMRQIYGLDDSATITLAFLKTNGTPSHMIKRLRKQNPAMDWNTLKNHLRQAFSNIVNSDHWEAQLWKIKQKMEEDIYTFTERVYYFIEKAYGSNREQKKGSFLNPQLITLFLDGLVTYFL